MGALIGIIALPIVSNKHIKELCQLKKNKN